MSDQNTEVSPIDIENMEFVPIEELFAHFLPDLPTEADADSNNGGGWTTQLVMMCPALLPTPMNLGVIVPDALRVGFGCPLSTGVIPVDRGLFGLAASYVWPSPIIPP